MTAALTIGVDIGGTKVAAGVVDDDGNVLAHEQAPTPSTSAEQVLEVVAAVVESLLATSAGRGVEAVGVGAAGLIDDQRSTVVFAPNLAWRHEPIRDRLAKRLSLPVVVENDGNAAAWAEHRFGAGRGFANMACLTIGTGIGGGLIIDGRLRRGAAGFGGEFGHIRVVPDGRRCGCGNRGCWEQYCSGRALVREAQHLALVDPAAAEVMLELADDEIENITGQVITRAARRGDTAALGCFEQVGGWLGWGIVGLAAILDSARFVVGGGVIDAGDLLLDPARRVFADHLLGRSYRDAPEIVAASLGPTAGLVGAADLARQA